MVVSDEEWRPVVGYEGVYSVSNLGRVRRERKRNGGILAGGTQGGRYLRVMLSCGRKETRPIHGLVAEAFIGPRPVGREINHRDGNKLNNRADNLEYVTHAENARHAVELGLYPRGEKNTAATISEEAVRRILDAFITTDATTRDLAKAYSLDYMIVRRILTRETWSHVSCDEGALARARRLKHHAGKGVRITPSIARAMRVAFAEGATYAQLAAENDVVYDTARRIVLREGRYADKKYD